MTPKGVMSTYLSCMFLLKGSGLLCTAHVCNSIHYTHQKLVVHILNEDSTLHESEVERSGVCCATAIDQAMFITTDIEKYASYQDAIKSNI